MLDGEGIAEGEAVHCIHHEQGIFFCRCHNAQRNHLTGLYIQNGCFPIVGKDVVGAFHIGIRQFRGCIPHHVHHAGSSCLCGEVDVNGTIRQVCHGDIFNGNAFGGLAVTVHNHCRINRCAICCGKVGHIHGTLAPQVDPSIIMGGELIGRPIDGQGQVLPCHGVALTVRNLNGGVGLSRFRDDLHIAHKGNACQVILLQHGAAACSIQLHRSACCQLNGIAAQQVIAAGQFH